MGGKKLMAVAPKDGYLYGFDLADNKLLYRTPVTRIENVAVALSPDKDVHFCPGAVGGAEWNSPAYDPMTNLIFTGQVDWCDTVRLQTSDKLRSVPVGQPWMGMESLNPFNVFGKFNARTARAGWLYAADADTGVWKWRLKSNYPIVGGVTPTAGGVVFFGDMGGNFYALDAATGQKLWGQNIGGAIGGGVITYTANGAQKVAVAAGFVMPAWPTKIGKSEGRGAGPVRAVAPREPMIASYLAARLFVPGRVLINQRKAQICHSSRIFLSDRSIRRSHQNTRQ